MRNSDFVAFILTHGRPNAVHTYESLKKAGYTGRIVIVIDNEDKKASEYYDRFGEEVYMFDKLAVSKTFDNADNFKDRRAIVYARNVCFDIAKELGITYFIELDDDYMEFWYKYDSKGSYCNRRIKNLDSIFDSLLEYYISIPAKSIAIAQNGDFIGGAENDFAFSRRRRKCMNTFICSTERPFKFVGRINEDVNTYTWGASVGALFMTIPQVAINQLTTQKNKGGMTDIYLDNGTYIKSFYSIMFQPSSVKIRLMGNSHPRLHHNINWGTTVPMIIEEKFKKK